MRTILFVILFTMCGCKTLIPASQTSDQKTPIVLTQASKDVLVKAIDGDAQILASALESIQDQGSVIYIDHTGALVDDTGNPYILENGEPIILRTKIVAKLNSLGALGGLKGDVEYVVGGSDIGSRPERLRHMQSCPVALRLTVKNADAVVDSKLPEVVDARGRERAAIMNGLSGLAKARGSVAVAQIQAVGDGLSKLVTVAGKEILGRVGPMAVVEQGIAGAKVLSGVFAPADGGAPQPFVYAQETPGDDDQR